MKPEALKFDTPLGNTISLSFTEGPRLDVIGNASAKYHVTFRNKLSGLIEYESTIENGWYASVAIFYYVPWVIEVNENDRRILSYEYSLKDKKVAIVIGSDGLGDTLAWIPYVEEFRKQHRCQIFAVSSWNEILRSEYPEITFIDRGRDGSESCFASYTLGVFDNEYNKNKNNWRAISLQQVASDLLGIEHREIRPKVSLPCAPRQYSKPYVAIAEFSTLKCKFWLRENGWQDLVDWLKDKGLDVICISKEQTALIGVVQHNNRPIEDTINVLKYAECFVGVSSGLSWLSWALGVKTVVISGATDPITEMTECVRVHNNKVCHGCFQDIRLPFDRGNWKWCPRNKNFECSTGITLDMVKRAVEPLIPGVMYKQPRFSLLMPTKNRARLVDRAVLALLGQDFENWELIIKDGSESLHPHSFKDPRIKYSHLPGVSFAERTLEAMREASGEILNFFADDDIMRPGTLRHVHDSISEAKWLYGRIQRSDGTLQGMAWNYALFCSMNIVPCPAAFWRRSAMRTVGAWDMNLACADYDYWHRLAARWEPKYTERVLSDYTIHSDQDTVQRSDQIERDRLEIVRRAENGFYQFRVANARRVLFIAPHCSTGGMPQYLVSCVKALKRLGNEIRVIEWRNVSNDYTVQRDQLKQLCDVVTFNGSKLEELKAQALQWRPDVVHLQEFPELFMETESMHWLYREGRPYRIVETGHSTRLQPNEKIVKPDSFVFVGDWHAKHFGNDGVPFSIARYSLPKRVRPPREDALSALKLDVLKQHVLSVGLFAPWKDQATIFEVARLLPDVQFHFIGNQAPNFFDYWHPLLQNKPDNCNVWGERRDVDSFYAACDLLLFPSTEECSPLAPKEALSWGMPVLMRKLEACAEEFEGKVTWIDGNTSDIAKQVIKTLSPFYCCLDEAYSAKQ